ncbi:MAG TPA: type II toxin-antitoxin system death-on-curing family toxin [Polyangiaceae bacterium]
MTQRRPVRFLTAEQVVAIHDDLLERWGGHGGGGHRGAAYEGADAAVQAVKNSYYDSIQELAAAYAVYVVQGHVFLDGNKRCGAAALLTFLQANGGKTRASPQRIAELMIELQERAEAGEATERLVRWLAAALRGRSP